MASMNSGIILAGQPVDFASSIGRGIQAAGAQNQISRQNALANLYQQQGAGIANGDPRALNALAAYDPQAAMQAKATQQNMQLTQQRMDALSEQEKRAASQYAAGLSKAQREQEAAQIETAVKMGMAAQDPQQWDALMSKMAPDLVGKFDQREMLGNRYMTLADILKQQQGPDQSNRFKVVGSQLVDLQAEGGPKAVMTAPGQEEVIYGSDGKPIMVRGPAGTSAKFTETQSKDVGFATRAEAALQTLDGPKGVANAYADRTGRVLDQTPLGIGRELQSQDYQVAQNAGTNFLLAILRKDTGAAVTPSEEEMYGKTFLPQPGDQPAILKQKKKARLLALNALKAGMNKDQILAQGQALISSGVAPGQVGEATTQDGQAGSQPDNQQPQIQLTPEQQSLLDKYR